MFSMALPVFMVTARDKAPRLLNTDEIFNFPYVGNSVNPEPPIPVVGDDANAKSTLYRLWDLGLTSKCEFRLFCDQVEKNNINYRLCTILFLPSLFSRLFDFVLKKFLTVGCINNN